MKFFAIHFTLIALASAAYAHPFIDIFKRVNACDGSCEDVLKLGSSCQNGIRINLECMCNLSDKFYEQYIDCVRNCGYIREALAEYGFDINISPDKLKEMSCKAAVLDSEKKTLGTTSFEQESSQFTNGATIYESGLSDNEELLVETTVETTAETTTASSQPTGENTTASRQSTMKTTAILNTPTTSRESTTEKNITSKKQSQSTLESSSSVKLAGSESSSSDTKTTSNGGQVLGVSFISLLAIALF